MSYLQSSIILCDVSYLQPSIILCDVIKEGEGFNNRKYRTQIVCPLEFPTCSGGIRCYHNGRNCHNNPKLFLGENILSNLHGAASGSGTGRCTATGPGRTAASRSNGSDLFPSFRFCGKQARALSYIVPPLHDDCSVAQGKVRASKKMW